MRKVTFLIALLPFIGFAHPGIGIVKNSKGVIYYTDLHRVWKINKGKKTVVVPDVHTHELYVDKTDNLYGEGSYYDADTKKFYHYMWVYHPDGQLDTVISMKEAYVHQDFSLARDKEGNEYYTKQFLKNPDTNHIYRKSPEGHETILATGNFKEVIWVHPQEDGSLLYVQKNTLYRIGTSGNIEVVKEQLGNAKPSFKFSGNSVSIWGTWQDMSGNIYVAAFSDQAVKKIDPNGAMTVVYKSKGAWAPLHGVFDNNNRLWVLESSDKNEVRVTLAPSDLVPPDKTTFHLPAFLAVVGGIVLGIALLYLKFRNVIASRFGSLRAQST